ncbi:hypothetical protein IZ6_23620 [Terrihabitans soli]|uniref:Flagellin n=1 Tax=Terrihabitans soli TaxID=708113 RepID=A0A6S6QUM0_9HYPH|nr:flagellin [Terrihabitans soli]BCJ91627.1 hypothetical protein IZ6_23620 [Terrihabitans soli]
MADITLSAGVRQNLLSLQKTADLMSTTQNRLATGKKVNSALDNPTNFFTSQSLSVRAGDMSALLDNMTAGIKTLEAADNGLTAITKTIESMQSTMRQARQDRSFKTGTYVMNMPTTPAGTEVLSFTGGQFGTTTETISLVTGSTEPVLTGSGAFVPLDVTTGDEVYGFNVTLDDGGAAGTPVTISLTNAADTDGDLDIELTEVITAINADLAAATSDVRVRDSVASPGRLEFYIASGTHIGTDATITVGTFTNGGTSPDPTTQFQFGATANADGGDRGRTVEEMVLAINSDTDLRGKIRASNDNGRLLIENFSTQEMTVTGFNTSGEITGGVSTQTIGGNSVRANLTKQYNELRDQLNKLADDASYGGVNLLRGDLLKLTFNETGTSTIDIQAKDLDGLERPINTSTLELDFAEEEQFDSEASIDARLDDLVQALGVIRSQSSNFGSNLSIVENRTEFTKAMINTLQTGADSLVLADTNEEAANMLALQTRQQLSQTALSLASQADQAVLRLFG